MSWCPKCKKEYIKSIKHCEECDVNLVENLDDIAYEIITTASSENNSQIIEFFEYYKIDSVISTYDSDTSSYIIKCAEYELEKAKEILKKYEDKQSEISSLQDDNDIMEDIPNNINEITKSSKTYVKKEDKYNDVLSSGYIFLIFGIVGLLALLLIVTNIIPLNLASPGKYLTYGVSALMLVVFIIIGIRSLASAKKLAVEAQEENHFINDVFEWFEKNITKDLIDEGIMLDSGEEIKYFKRYDNIKTIITKTFGELNESFLDKLADDIYTKMY